MKCDIIIPIWNQPEFTKDCISHIIKNTHSPYRLILINNASDHKTRDYLEGLKNVNGPELIMMCNDENLGFVKAVNQGLKISSAPYICILNNDTIPADGWLEKMLDFAEIHKDVGLINPQCDGHLDTSIEAYAKDREKYRGIYMEMNQCQGFCMLIKREVIDKIGYLDESFGIGGFDDTDFSMRAYRAGYRSVCIYDSYVYHRQHKSFNALQTKRERIVKENEAIYFNKWGRHLRIAYVVTPAEIRNDIRLKEIILKILSLAREWCWVHVWVFGDIQLIGKFKDQIKELEMPLHQNIRYYFNQGNAFFSRVFITAFVMIKLLERSFGTKRRKRYDAVLLSGEGLKSFVDSFRYLHRAASLKDAGLAPKEIIEFIKNNAGKHSI
ncbi:MAG: glycosyltransferase family 2 protein [Candidatus Omnitrophica bacterium]|nr:glycosyltransferase family 2 protein [Candidatus Omnitrophota bacterium]